MSEENNNNNEKVTTAAGTKRDNEEATAPSVGEEPNKKIKSEDEDNKPALPPADESAESHAFVPPGTVGVTQIGDNDVLSGKQSNRQSLGVFAVSLSPVLLCAKSGWKLSACLIACFILVILSNYCRTTIIGRGGGTNLHPGNRQFRDLINLYRRDYLKARKNDKPAISRSIVSRLLPKQTPFLLLHLIPIHQWTNRPRTI